jgi:polysaccharide export outer membrane protein
MAYDIPLAAQPAPELLVQKGDKLEIQVFSSVPELTAPFRMSSVSESIAADVYTVNKDGCILFPALGIIPVEGETMVQVEERIAGMIRKEGYINEPVVRVQLANFTITVIGSTGNTVIPVEDGSINLLQVIAKSGGTNDNTNIHEVTVIRNERGFRTAYKVDLQTKELFDSPVFYLRQNDIVYVKPQGLRLSSEGQLVMTFVSSALSLGSIIANFLIWYRR